MPIGIENFQRLLKENYYYVDKTNIISAILNNKGLVHLFTRPRRFGKTLTMSMLKSFFENGTDKSLLDGLAISEEKELCEQHMGKYPAISISLKEVDGLTFESAYDQLRGLIYEEALRQSSFISDNERISYNRIITQNDTVADIKGSLKMLEYYNMGSHYCDIRKWYDGYLFGNQEIYCPWDVIYYCFVLRMNSNAKPEAYLANSIENRIVRKLIEIAKDDTTKGEIKTLVAGDTIPKKINMQLTHDEIYDNINNIWSLLYMTGYLTTKTPVVDGICNLCIPNKEILLIFREQVLAWFKDETKTNVDELKELFLYFEQGNVEGISNYLDYQLTQTISFYDEKEAFYHGFMIELLTTNRNWYVASNDEASDGRADIIVEHINRKIGFVVELKVVKDIEKLDNACVIALKQIEDKDYTAILRKSRFKKIFAYGIAFCGKNCKVIVKELA